MQRRNVDLPEPLPPMMAITSPSRADSDTPFSTSQLAEFLVQVLDVDGFGGAGALHDVRQRRTLRCSSATLRDVSCSPVSMF